MLAKTVAGKRPKEIELCNEVSTLIEVKRSKAPAKEIDTDIMRLSKSLEVLKNPGNKEVRCFILVTGEGRAIPSRFACAGKGKKDTDVTARKGRHDLASGIGQYQARRFWRAQAALKSSKAAYGACLVEIYCA